MFPLWARKALVDAIEGAVVAVLALNLVIPSTLDEAKAQGIILGGAVFGAIVAAVRRNLPAALIWLRETLGVPAG